MIADRRAARARLATEQPDRCPCPRPFGADFAGCATFQPVSFVGIDSLNRPLAATVTCRHLTVGDDEARQGRFYPRCGVGDAEARRRWLAAAGPERVAVTAALQEELDAATRSERDALHAAKAEVLAAPDDPEPRERLDRTLRLHLATLRSFVLSNQARLEDAGLPADAVLDLVEEWVAAWADTRGGGVAHLLRDLGNLVAPAEVLPGAGRPSQSEERHLVGRRTAARLPRAEPAQDAAGAAMRTMALTVVVAPASTVLVDTPSLRVLQTAEPAELRIAGDVDAGTAALLGAALARALRGRGDHHVDLGEVLFCDLAGLRALVAAAQQLDRGGRLVLHRVPAHLRRAMAVAGWSELPSLVLVPGETDRRTRPVYAADAPAAPFTDALPPPPDRSAAIPFDATALHAVRHHTARAAARAGLRSARVADMVMAVNEAATNSLQHGGGSGTLRTWSEVDRVVCEVADRGRFAAPLAGRVRPGSDTAPGRGLWLANQLCDLVQVRTSRHGTTVRLHMRTA